MKIAIDLRSLSSGSISGVENYIVCLLEHLLPMDRQNEYVLYYNALRKKNLNNFQYINSRLKQTNLPNKLLSAGFKLGLTQLEAYTGDVDAVFLPNLNPFRLRPQTRLALTVHDLSPVVTPEFYDLRRRLWHKFLNYKKAFERADVIFAVSEYTKLDLLRIFRVPENKIRVVYPGIDLAAFAAAADTDSLKLTRNAYQLPGKFILYLSTVEPRKNFSGLLTAFQQLAGDAHLVIVGKKGWKYGNFFQDINRSKKRDKIHYVGYVPEKDKANIIALAACVAYPSFYEGFGFVPLEAMALGVPVVASSVTSLPEVCGQGALLVNPYKPAEISWALQEALENKVLRESLTAKAKAQAQRFSWDSTAQGVLEGLMTLS